MLLPAAQDHKRVFDGDQGPNTGGMGALSPAPVMTDALSRRVEREILVPAVHALAMQGTRFSGLLYAGLMITRGVPKVLEFNVRFGDPETQVIVPRLTGDFGELLAACVDGHVLAAAAVGERGRSPRRGIGRADRGRLPRALISAGIRSREWKRRPG